MNDLLYWLRKSLTYTIDGDTVTIVPKFRYAKYIEMRPENKRQRFITWIREVFT